ncbi:hypothetical protein GGR56DRAFT_359695 [Xylariaceae sp. FL0804]|nr:hypothetical protein GGR56DRAFT_359695 [Xylariaceae sp. FL0804]
MTSPTPFLSLCVCQTADSSELGCDYFYGSKLIMGRLTHAGSRMVAPPPVGSRVLTGMTSRRLSVCLSAGPAISLRRCARAYLAGPVGGERASILIAYICPSGQAGRCRPLPVALPPGRGRLRCWETERRALPLAGPETERQRERGRGGGEKLDHNQLMSAGLRAWQAILSVVVVVVVVVVVQGGAGSLPIYGTDRDTATCRSPSRPVRLGACYAMTQLLNSGLTGRDGDLLTGSARRRARRCFGGVYAHTEFFRADLLPSPPPLPPSLLDRLSQPARQAGLSLRTSAPILVHGCLH